MTYKFNIYDYSYFKTIIFFKMRCSALNEDWYPSSDWVEHFYVFLVQSHCMIWIKDN